MAVEHPNPHPSGYATGTDIAYKWKYRKLKNSIKFVTVIR